MAKGNMPVLGIGYDTSPVTIIVEPLLLKFAELAVSDRSRLVVVRNVFCIRIVEYRD
jgi:hypothetical protein